MSSEVVQNVEENDKIQNQKQSQGSTSLKDEDQKQQQQNKIDMIIQSQINDAPLFQPKHLAIQNINQAKQDDPVKKQQSTGQIKLNIGKSQQQLKNEFEQHEKILSNLSFNIDDLFKKISSLTEEVQSQIVSKPISSTKSLQNIQSPRKKIENPVCSSQKLIQVKNPIVQKKLSCEQQIFHQYNDKQISMKMFQIGQSLGYGKFGEVLECRHKQTGILFALKKIFKSTIYQYDMNQQLLIELQACKRMNHPSIIKSYTSFTDEFHIFLITQYALGCKLTKKFNSPQKEVSKIIYQVIQALKFMHSQGVVHRDLKPQNILIDQGGNIKICDFGWSSLIQKAQKMNIICGTLDYVSPQMVNGSQYTKEVDLWSVGVLTYELIFGTAPFKSENKAGTFEKVKNLQLNFPGAYRFSGQCLDFISKLLKPEAQRMRLEDCFVHPFITNYTKEIEVKNEDFNNLFE